MTDHFVSPIFITGLPRSGTSMVAGIFHACGAWLGTTVPGNAHNPRGYFEHHLIRDQVVKPILAKVGGDPLGVTRLPPLQPGLEVDRLKDILETVIERDGYSNDRPWLYKDAKLSLVWPAFDHAFPQAHWIVVRRKTAHVIDSCLQTPFMAQHSGSRAFWEKFVEAYELRLQALTATASDVSCVSAEGILEGDYGELRTLLPRCQLNFDEALARSFVSRDFWHQTD